MKKPNQLTESVLRQFTGTEQWYRHALVRHVLYTDGVQHVAEHGGAYWLIDEIAFAQQGVPEVAAQAFQAWTLEVAENSTATLTCEDGDYNAVYSKEIPYTDFPLPKITFWYTNNVILLPSEY